MAGAALLQALVLVFVLLSRGATAACAACPRRRVFREPATTVTLAATEDLSNCVCDFTFEYSVGSHGKVRIEATPGVGAFGVFAANSPDDPLEVTTPLAEFAAEDMLQGATVHAYTGVVHVTIVTGPSVPVGSSVTVAATAINQPPTIEQRFDAKTLEREIFVPWGGDPFPLAVYDVDNNDLGLRVELALSGDPLVALWLPTAPGVVFEEGSVGTLIRRAVMLGPGDLVSQALDAAFLVPTAMAVGASDVLVVTASDLGNAGEGSGALVTTFRKDVKAFARDAVVVPRGAQRLSSGDLPQAGTVAVFNVQGAAQLQFTDLIVAVGFDRSECLSSIRVWDGDAQSGRLLSTELSPTGELCGENTLLPTYTASSGAFEVELVATFNTDAFEAAIVPAPEGFRVWALDGTDTIEAATGGDGTTLPRIMVTSLPVPNRVAVNASAVHGRVLLRFADSYSDIGVGGQDARELSLELVTDVPAMLRVGDALSELVYLPPKDGGVDTDTVTVQAWSDGVEAAPLVLQVALARVVITAPTSLSIHAFQPVRLPVTLDGATEVTVSVTSGIGQLSVDPRAAVWIDVGFGSALTVPPEKLSDLVYKASDGGVEEVVIAAGSVAHRISLLVDPECDGSHFVYGRIGTITERAGPVPEQHSGSLLCDWSVVGARVLSWPYFELSLGTSFFVSNSETQPVPYFIFIRSPPGDVVSTETVPFFSVRMDAMSIRTRGFVGELGSLDTFNDPPVVVVPADMVVVRESTTPLRTLYVDDFSESLLTVSLETSAGSLGSTGTQVVEIRDATFAQVDAWITGLEYIAGGEQTTATLVLTASDDGGAEASQSWAITVLPCDGIADVVLADASASAVVTDGSDAADYAPQLGCGWRLTGAAAPAVLVIEYLDLDCSGGDLVSVYEGSSAAGRFLGSFCQARAIVETFGSLVSSTGSFFVALETDGDGAQDDGFSFVYRGISAQSATNLGAAPDGADPARTDGVVASVGSAGVVVFGGHNGVRPVASSLWFEASTGWTVLRTAASTESPSARWRAAGTAVEGRVVVHGGLDAAGTVLADTWMADVDASAATITWTRLNLTGPAPATASAAMHGTVLVDVSGVWMLGGDSWTLLGATPDGVISTSSASVDGTTVYAVDAKGGLWTLAIPSGIWTPVGLAEALPIECAPWTCSGAMLGPDEYVVAGARVNVTSLSVDTLPAAAAGQTVGGQYLGQPALFVYSSAAMAAVALTLGVASHGPLVSPETGGTTVSVAGEQLSSCGDPMCEFGGTEEARASPLTVGSERTGTCLTPTGGAGVVPVVVSCADGRRYSSPDPLVYFATPSVASVEPAAPRAGEVVTIALAGVSSDTLLAAATTTMCRFDDGVPVPANVDSTTVRCRLPASTAVSVKAEISLDGQQFLTTAEIPLVESGGSRSVMPVGAVIGVCLALVVFALVAARYRRLAAARVASGPAPWEIDFGTLELLDVIGSGGFGSVYRGRYRGGQVAVKLTKDPVASRETMAAFRKESALMAELRHPNIVLFMGACTEPPNIAIVLEFMPNGSLFDVIHNEAVIIRAAERTSFALDIVKGMAYLHGADPPIVHRDLKSLNVLVDKNWTLKVSDFGTTQIFDGGSPAGADAGTTGASPLSSGSIQAPAEPMQLSAHWTAPEVLRGEPATCAGDIYSYGITLWEICTRDLPYAGLPALAVATRLAADDTFRPHLDRVAIGDKFSSVIADCWARLPESRPTFAALQRRLVEDAHDGDSGSILTDAVSQSDSGPAPGMCCVVLVLPDSRAMWESDPREMHAALDAARQVAAQQCECLGGRALMDDPELETMEFVFPTCKAGAKFVAVMLRESRLTLAGGLAGGHVEITMDPTSRQQCARGDGATRAHALAATGCSGRQVAASRGVLDTGDAAAAGLVLVNGEDTDTVWLSLDEPKQDIAVVERPAGAASFIIASNELEIGSLIGAGSFGTVFKATWHGTVVAAKQLHRRKLGAKETLELRAEGGVASKLRHPHICLVLGVCKDVEAGKTFVVSEYMSKGSVFDAIVTARKDIAGKIKNKVAKGMALGLRYLHEQSPAILHRSLTARNVLLGKDWTAKLSDFGLARVKDGAASMTRVGGTAYSAPEVIKGERYDEKADVYAYAVVLWEMLAQQPAWRGAKMRVVVDAVVAGQRPVVEDRWRAEVGVGFVDAMAAGWRGAAAERPTMEEIGRFF